ncbi:DUF6415 family natural product biosynthesis protein [Streptomyces sp. O3]
MDALTWTDIERDVRLALVLGGGQPTGETADALRGRLRGYIVILAPAADAYTAALADGRPKDIATDTVRRARALAGRTETGPDPAMNLRMLAKAVHYTALYASRAPRA